MLAALDLWGEIRAICWGGCEPRPGSSGHPDRSREGRVGGRGEPLVRPTSAPVRFFREVPFHGPVYVQARYAEAVRDPHRDPDGALFRAVLCPESGVRNDAELR